MCSGPEAGSYLRLIDFVYHSTLGVGVIKKRRRRFLDAPGRQKDRKTERQKGRQGGGSYLRRIDSCITQLKAQGPSRTCNASKEERQARRLTGVGGRLEQEVED